jgi:monovalent cation:H+ antiporter-2, CPA2 family
MHDVDLILTLAGALAIALVFGYFTQRMGLSPIVGYLLAGIASGPHTPGFVANREVAEQLAELGVVLLMFGVGLEFHLKQLLAVRRIAVPGAIFQSLVATALGALVAHWFGWDWSAGVIFGLAISVASTVVLMRVLADNRDLHTPAGHIAVGWLVVEDLFTVLVLVLLPALFGGEGANLPIALVTAVLKVVVLVAFVFLVGGRVIPWLLARVALTRSRELFTLTVLVVALGIAVGSAKIFGVSMALGAFLAGMVVGRSEFSLRAASEALPMRDAFAVLFFVSVGLLLDPVQLLEEPGLIAATLVVILVGKPLAALSIVLVLGHPLKTALAVSVALAQIGEFSFILASLGRNLGIFPPEGMACLVAAAIISISINPLIYRTVDPVARWLGQVKPLAARLRLLERRRRPAVEEADGEPAESSPRYRSVVIGYGPVGRTLVRLLRENEVVPTVVELNLPSVQALRAHGIDAIYGDASHRETLRGAGVPNAGTLILSSSNTAGNAEVIRLAKELNPKIRVLARTTYVSEVHEVKRAGADVVFPAEGEIALALAVAVLRDLGASGEQIDRERERVYRELMAKT